jgi:Retrotransposon gag protein
MVWNGSNLICSVQETLNDHPLWMDIWQEFKVELQTTFRPPNSVANAEHQLDQLQMKENHRVNKYIVDFNQLALQVMDYGNGAL